MTTLKNGGDPNCLMTQAEVARYLGYSISALEKWRSRKVKDAPRYIKMPGIKGGIRYRWKDVQAFLERHTIDNRDGEKDEC